VVDADDAAQSACLPIRAAGASDDKRNGPAVISARMDCIPFRLDIRPLAEFSCDENSIPKRCSAGALLYCQPSPAATARRPASFVLQVRNGLGTVPEHDFASLQQRAPHSTACCFFRCGLHPLLLQHPKRARCPFCCFANRRGPCTRGAPRAADPRNWYLLGRYWQYNLEDPDAQRAIRFYLSALSLNPLSPETWLDLATAYESESNLVAARDAFLHAKKVYPLSADGLLAIRQFPVAPWENSSRPSPKCAAP